MPYLLIALFQIVLASSSLEAEPASITDARYTDLVVRGTIAGVRHEQKPRADAMPMLPPPDREYSVVVAIVDLHVSEVIRGEFVGETLSFVSFVSSSLFRDNYEPGQELIAGLIWGASVLGGSYYVFSDAARLVRQPDGQWEGQDGARNVDIEQFRSSLRSSEPDQVLARAEAIAVGEVRDARVESIVGPDNTSAIQMTVSLTNVQWLSGGSGEEALVVKQIMSGDYWPAWRDPAPWRELPVTGRRYCYSLRKVDDGFAVFGGINGTFEVRENRLYFAGRSRVNLTTGQVKSAFGNK